MITGELGDFLRNRRESVRPEDVGLPSGTRRQTPGLRRSEVATLAGVSVEYLTRLEQGRDARPSTQVLAALAQALRLPSEDREHLQQLATIGHGTELCAHARRTASRAVRPTVQLILGRLDPTPAAVINHLTDLVAWNDAYERLARPVGLLDADEPNLARFVFTDPRARDAYPDWPAMADDQVAHLHSHRHGDPAADELAEELSAAAGDAFASRWSRRLLASGRTGTLTIAHPEVGPLRLSFESLTLGDHDEQRLVVHLPADTAGTAALDRLVGRAPGALRTLAR